MKQLVALVFIVAVTISAVGQNSVIRLEGQVVCCAECWAEADRTKEEFGTAEDLLKARSCVEGGDPTLLAVPEGVTFKLYQLGIGKYRLPGKNWLEFIGKRVAVTGTLQSKKVHDVIRVDSVEVLSTTLAEREASKVVGQQIDLSLNDLSDVPQSINRLKGRIVLLNFWATYCIPCRKEMPDLAMIQNEFAPLGLQVIGVSTDELGDRLKVLQFVKETKLNFPIWVGGTAEDMVRFGLGVGLPGTVVIGRDGRISKVISGVVDLASLRKEVERLLAQSGGEVAASRAEATERKVSTVPS
jgi:thiol-disulfide isomerase/thioredoxin